VRVPSLSWWHGATVKCEGCELLFPTLDDVGQVVTVQGDPCDWHRGFLNPVTAQEAAEQARR
jgi:hypothetical protein